MALETGFRKATLEQSRLRLALAGPAGAGKTYTMLALARRIAQRLGGRVGVVDTERGSASKYAAEFDFDILDLTPPFTPKAYVNAIKLAEQAGLVVLGIDSLSHGWAGPGGVLEMVDNITNRTHNKFAAWSDVTPLHNELVDTILNSPLHIVCTMRSKMDHVQEKDSSGKTVVRKLGMAPVQREGIEYEFDVFGNLDENATLTVVKTRCSVLTGRAFHHPGDELADLLMDWITTGAAVADRAATPPPPAPDPTGAPVRTPEGPWPGAATNGNAPDDDPDGLPSLQEATNGAATPPAAPKVKPTPREWWTQMATLAAEDGLIATVPELASDAPDDWLIEDGKRLQQLVRDHRAKTAPAPATAQPTNGASRPSGPPATQTQLDTIGKLARSLNRQVATNGLTRAAAAELITSLSEERYGQRPAAAR